MEEVEEEERRRWLSLQVKTITNLIGPFRQYNTLFSTPNKGYERFSSVGTHTMRLSRNILFSSSWPKVVAA